MKNTHHACASRFAGCLRLCLLLVLCGISASEAKFVEVEYARILANAFESRQDADYDVAFYTDKDLAQEMLRDAMRFVARIELFLSKAGVL